MLFDAVAGFGDGEGELYDEARVAVGVGCVWRGEEDADWAVEVEVGCGFEEGVGGVCAGLRGGRNLEVEEEDVRCVGGE